MVTVFFVVPFIFTVYNTVSTDAGLCEQPRYVCRGAHSRQVVNVLVDDNNRVRKGDILVQLDKTPFKLVVEVNKALVETAKAELEVTTDEVRGMIATARANRFKLEHTIEDVNNQVAQLRAYRSGARNQPSPFGPSQGRLGSRQGSAKDARRHQPTRCRPFARKHIALRSASETVAGTGLSNPGRSGFAGATESGNLTEVPENLDQTFSTVRQALADLMVSAAPLGIVPPSWNATPKEVIDAFLQARSGRKFDRIYAKLLPEAPAIKLRAGANAKSPGRFGSGQFEFKLLRRGGRNRRRDPRAAT